ncbi:hypothetical protein LCGC14_2275980 [marine sediment metagenome]|uniref:Secreted protein n=1 Tax=marine sediment metagenome TaxID=412755 RepID=A0A0F9F839_9ZZZZ
MPLNRLLLILATVIAAAALTVWLGTLLAGSVTLPGPGWLLAAPLAYLLWRVIQHRLRPVKGGDPHDG